MMFRFSDKNIIIMPDEFDYAHLPLSNTNTEPNFVRQYDDFIECPFCHNIVSHQEDGEGIITCSYCHQKF